MDYLDHILHTNAYQHCLTTGMCYSHFDGRVFQPVLAVIVNADSS